MPADVSELEALAAKMATAGARVRREQAKIVKETTERVAQDARGLAPNKTGALSGSIEPSARGLKGLVTASIRYAQFVEFGTYKDAPQPFMAPARDQNVGQYVADSQAAAERALDF